MRPGLLGGGFPPSLTSEIAPPPPPPQGDFLAQENDYLILQEDGSFIETE